MPSLANDKKYPRGMNENFEKYFKLISRPDSELEGMLPEILEPMGQKLNFSVHYSLFLSKGLASLKTSTKNFQRVDSKWIPLLNILYDLTDESSHFTTPYFLQNLIILCH